MTFDCHNKNPIDLFGPMLGKALEPHIKDDDKDQVSVGKLRSEVRKLLNDATMRTILDAMTPDAFRMMLSQYMTRNLPRIRFVLQSSGRRYTLVLRD